MKYDIVQSRSEDYNQKDLKRADRHFVKSE